MTEITDAEIGALLREVAREEGSAAERLLGACERALDGSRHAYVRRRARMECARAIELRKR